MTFTMNGLVIFTLVAFERVSLAKHNPLVLSSERRAIMLDRNNILYCLHNFKGDSTTFILFKYYKPMYGSRKATYAAVEYGPGSFKRVHSKPSPEYLFRQLKQLLTFKKEMENKN